MEDYVDDQEKHFQCWFFLCCYHFQNIFHYTDCIVLKTVISSFSTDWQGLSLIFPGPLFYKLLIVCCFFYIELILGAIIWTRQWLVLRNFLLYYLFKSMFHYIDCKVLKTYFQFSKQTDRGFACFFVSVILWITFYYEFKLEAIIWTCFLAMWDIIKALRKFLFDSSK